MPRKKSRKPQWTDPIVLVPIIAAVITAIVGPNFGRIMETIQNLQQPPSDNGGILGPMAGNSLSLRTDKKVYGNGDLVKVTGTLAKPVQGKTVRLDVYDPEGNVFQPLNESFSEGPRERWTEAYPRLTGVQVQPSDKGELYYQFPIDDPVLGSIIKGWYKIEATYGDRTANATFKVR